MTNYEKYGNEIIETFRNSPNGCDDFVCRNVLEPMNLDCHSISCDVCHHLFSVWLLNEYKKPEKPEIDWSKVSVDTKIYVRDATYESWTKRYFAKYEDGNIYAWDCGFTSWSAVSEEQVVLWKYAKLAEEGDIKRE